MNPETAEADVDNIMKAIDYNNSGAIDYSGKNTKNLSFHA